MRYLNMVPSEIKKAVKNNIPVIICAGAVEYHGEQLPIGTDYLIVKKIADEIEKRCDVVIMPSLPFSPTYNWAGCASDGEFNFSSESLMVYSYEMLKHIVNVGFRRIYIIQLHQGDEGSPATALRYAANRVVEEMAKSFSPGWSRYGRKHYPEPDILDMIKVRHLTPFPNNRRMPLDHAGIGETQLMMSGYAELVKTDKKNPPYEWLEKSHLADKIEGDKWYKWCVDDWVLELTKM